MISGDPKTQKSFLVNLKYASLSLNNISCPYSIARIVFDLAEVETEVQILVGAFFLYPLIRGKKQKVFKG